MGYNRISDMETKKLLCVLDVLQVRFGRKEHHSSHSQLKTFYWFRCSSDLIFSSFVMSFTQAVLILSYVLYLEVTQFDLKSFNSLFMYQVFQFP